jgi:RHS repeat-associated protein
MLLQTKQLARIEDSRQSESNHGVGGTDGCCVAERQGITVLSGTNYDSDGHVLNDTFHAYTWNAYDTPITMDGLSLLYDALDRQVEINNGSTRYQIIYSPVDNARVTVQGNSASYLRVPLLMGAFAQWNNGVPHYSHADWLGSIRESSSSSRTSLGNTAHAPFGEAYAVAGNPDQTFAGISEFNFPDTNDATFRKYNSTQGRWLSPDPAGIAAVNPADPQTWNRYAYVANRPLTATDPLGLFDVPDDFGGGGGGFGPCDALGILVCGPPGSPLPCFADDPNCDLPIGPIVPPGGFGGAGGEGGVAGGGAASQPQRKGGVWPGNETLGLPAGLNLKPATLADILGLSPGTQCDFGVCRNIGNSLVGIDDAAEGILCIAQPEACAAILVGTFIIVNYGPQILKAIEDAEKTRVTCWEDEPPFHDPAMTAHTKSAIIIVAMAR